MQSLSKSSELGIDRSGLERAAKATLELQRRRTRAACQKSLRAFIETFWPIVEPARELVWGWALDAVVKHLEAVADGRIRNLLINVPPGFLKSLATDVFLPAWEWGPRRMPSLRYLTFSYSSSLTERDNGRFAQIIQSPLYRSLFGDVVTFRPYALGATKVANLQTGWKIASSVGGVGTGERGDRLVIDDPHNVKDAESEAVRSETVRWFRESLTTRYNDPSASATIVIMQRVHEDDVSGTILSEFEDYVHLSIPMHYDPARHCVTYTDDGEFFWEDPRTEDGELAFPERFPDEVVARDEIRMGPSASAAQFEQSPQPRHGNIIKDEWWKLWPAPGFEPKEGEPLVFPPCEIIIGSVDTNYGQKEENAWNAMEAWGVWRDKRDRPKAILMEAWRARLPLRGVIPEEAKTEDERRKHWGLAEKIADTVRRRAISILLIENKTRGADLADELRRIFDAGECSIVMIDPKGDKVARAHAVQALFADGLVYAPDKSWAQMVIDEMAAFPKGKWADLTDCATQALTWLRKQGMLLFGVEADEDNLRANTFRSERPPPYEV